MSVFVIQPESIDRGVYGSRTGALTHLIARAKSLPWKATAGDGEILPLVAEHLRRLARAADAEAVAQWTPGVVSGGWSVLPAAIRMVRGDDPGSADEWRTRLGDVTRGMQERLRATDAASIHPPLFPVERNPMVLGGMLLDAERHLARIETRHRDAVWSLMCDVDRDFWGAILWSLANGEESPFEPLISTYEAGYFPLGVSGGRFIVFAHTT